MPFDFATLAFLGFAATATIAGLATVTARNPVHAALWLVLTFFSVACTWIIGGAEFLGIVLVLVYVGAVMVLFLFVVMMLDVDSPRRESYVRYLPVGIVVAVVMLVQVLALVGVRAAMEAQLADNAAVATAELSNTRWLAEALFTRFMLPFETAAVILTVAVIAAVMLTLRRRSGVRHQNPAVQASTRAEGRVRLVRMQAEVPQPQAPATDAAEGEGKA